VSILKQTSMYEKLFKNVDKPIEKRDNEGQSIIAEVVLSVYRNLRENYEFRLRYGDAGKFFIKEMELKRKYRESPSVSAVFKSKLIKLLKKLKLVNINTPEPKIESELKLNWWGRRNLSLTGLYFHFSKYGESIVRPTIIAAITVGLSTLFWSMQASPTLQPTFSTNAHYPYSNFSGPNNITNHIQLLTAFQRSLADFLPILSLPGDIKVGVIDYIIKIVGGALTFGLLVIAFRRKFERKYTR
jgi:hypothetical protein